MSHENSKSIKLIEPNVNCTKETIEIDSEHVNHKMMLYFYRYFLYAVIQEGYSISTQRQTGKLKQCKINSSFELNFQENKNI